MKEKIKVLMVCHGNICRSPMAEFVFKDILTNRNLSHNFYVSSAATSTEEIWNGVGNPVYPPAKAELAKHGISCDGKRAVQVTKADYDNYDYLICMDSSNLRNLARIVGPDRDNKVSLLLDYTDRKGASIADPWYTRDFGATYKDVVDGLNGFLKYLGME